MSLLAPTDRMDPAIIQLTQQLLGAFVKRPQLTDKLLRRPPFRFLHDLIMSIVKETGLMEGLFTDAEMNSENVSTKDSKKLFLRKVIEFTRLASRRELSVSPAQIIAGLEPEKTNRLLQDLARVISTSINCDHIVIQVLKGSGTLSNEACCEPNTNVKDGHVVSRPNSNVKDGHASSGSNTNVKDGHVNSGSNNTNVKDGHVISMLGDQQQLSNDKPSSDVNNPSHFEMTNQPISKTSNSVDSATGLRTSTITNKQYRPTSHDKDKKHTNSEVRLENNLHSGVTLVAPIESIRAAASKKLASSIDHVSKLQSEVESKEYKPVKVHRNYQPAKSHRSDRKATPIPSSKSSSTNLATKDTIGTLVEESVEDDETKHPFIAIVKLPAPLLVSPHLKNQASLLSSRTKKKSDLQSSKILQPSETAKVVDSLSLEVGEGNKSLEVGERNKSLNVGEGSKSLEAGEGSKSLEAGEGSKSLKIGQRNKSLDLGEGIKSLEIGEGIKSLEVGVEIKSLEAGEGSKSRPKGIGVPIKSAAAQAGKKDRIHVERHNNKMNVHLKTLSGSTKVNNSRLDASVHDNNSLLVTRPKIILDRVLPSDDEDDDSEDDQVIPIFNIAHLESASYSLRSSSIHSANSFNNQIYEEEHGQLVKMMLETSRRGFQESSRAHTVIDRTEERFSLLQEKERKKATKDSDHLRLVIQGLTGSILELIKAVDMVQEHHQSIQKETEAWRKEVRDNDALLELEQAITDASIEPLAEQLTIIEREIADQLESSAGVKVQILNNEAKLLRMIRESSTSHT